MRMKQIGSILICYAKLIILSKKYTKLTVGHLFIQINRIDFAKIKTPLSNDGVLTVIHEISWL